MKRLPEEDRLFTCNVTYQYYIVSYFTCIHFNIFISVTTNTSLVTKHILIELQNLVSEQFPHIVWTKNLRRLMVLLRKTFQYKEPALLVGDTGKIYFIFINSYFFQLVFSLLIKFIYIHSKKHIYCVLGIRYIYI